MTPFGMVGKLSTEPQDRETLIGILMEAAELMKGMDGCQLYVVTKDMDNASAVWVMELWESREAHDLSLTLPDVRKLISKAMPILRGSPEGASLIPVGGKGL